MTQQNNGLQDITSITDHADLNNATQLWVQHINMAAENHLKGDDEDFPSPYTIALCEDIELQQIEKMERAERHKYNTDIHKNKTTLKSLWKTKKDRKKNIMDKVHEQQWAKLEGKITADPSYI